MVMTLIFLVIDAGSSTVINLCILFSSKTFWDRRMVHHFFLFFPYETSIKYAKKRRRGNRREFFCTWFIFRPPTTFSSAKFYMHKCTVVFSFILVSSDGHQFGRHPHPCLIIFFLNNLHLLLPQEHLLKRSPLCLQFHRKSKKAKKTTTTGDPMSATPSWWIINLWWIGRNLLLIALTPINNILMLPAKNCPSIIFWRHNYPLIILA